MLQQFQYLWWLASRMKRDETLTAHPAHFTFWPNLTFCGCVEGEERANIHWKWQLLLSAVFHTDLKAVLIIHSTVLSFCLHQIEHWNVYHAGAKRGTEPTLNEKHSKSRSNFQEYSKYFYPLMINMGGNVRLHHNTPRKTINICFYYFSVESPGK